MNVDDLESQHHICTEREARQRSPQSSSPTRAARATSIPRAWCCTRITASRDNYPGTGGRNNLAPIRSERTLLILAEERDSNPRSRAEAWLSQFSGSPEAWSRLGRLLHPSRSHHGDGQQWTSPLKAVTPVRIRGSAIESMSYEHSRRGHNYVGQFSASSGSVLSNTSCVARKAIAGERVVRIAWTFTSSTSPPARTALSAAAHPQPSSFSRETEPSPTRARAASPLPLLIAGVTA
jgi:hypothetical protein